MLFDHVRFLPTFALCLESTIFPLKPLGMFIDATSRIGPSVISFQIRTRYLGFLFSLSLSLEIVFELFPFLEFHFRTIVRFVRTRFNRIDAPLVAKNERTNERKIIISSNDIPPLKQSTRQVNGLGV